MGLGQQQDFSLPGNKRKNNSGHFVLMKIFSDITHPVYTPGIMTFNDSVKRHQLTQVSFYFYKQTQRFIHIGVFRQRKTGIYYTFTTPLSEKIMLMLLVIPFRKRRIKNSHLIRKEFTMKKRNNSGVKKSILDWQTVSEAVNIINQTTGESLTESDIYRHALGGDICLSVYFQSPVILRKISQANNKIRLREADYPLIKRFCYLESHCFMHDLNLVASTEGDFFLPEFNVIDTLLTGYEYVTVQRLLARKLRLPPPVKGGVYQNMGVSVFIAGEIFQTFEKITWQERIKHQIIKLPSDMAQNLNAHISEMNSAILYQREFFPLHDLPGDACFVIRRTEIEKLLTLYSSSPASTRMSSALARFLWLACWQDESIRSLINQPYKLVTVFEQWAVDAGITDRLSGDTLKTALERGSPRIR